MSNASMIMEFLEYLTDKRITYKKLRDKRLTCEGKPWINMTEGLSALPLSTQNHLLHKIIYTEHVSIGNPANNPILNFAFAET